MADFTATRLFTYINGTIIDPGQNNPNENEIYNKHNASMNATTGHKHTGTVGDGPLLGATSLDLAATYPWTGTHSFGSTSTVSFANDFTVAATKKIFFGVGGDTYIYEAAANVIHFFTGGANRFRIGDTLVYTDTGVDFAIQPTQRLYLDGGGDTYIYEESANVIAVVAGGVFSARFGTLGFSVPSTQKIWLDGGGDTFIQEVAANHLKIQVGGADRVDYEADGTEGHSGEMLLPNVDPPTANYMNRNSGVKAFAVVLDNGTILGDSYNISSITHTVGTGVYTVVWNTNFDANGCTPIVSSGDTAHIVSFTGASSSTSLLVGTRLRSTGVADDCVFSICAFGGQ